MNRRDACLCLAHAGLSALLLGAGVPAAAQTGASEWKPPETGFRIVIPFGPGSGTDVYARMVAQHLGAAMSVPVVIDNRPGANGAIAAEMVARAAPDGATFLLTTNTTHAANPHLVKGLRYDPVRDFEPISRMGSLTFFVLVAGDSPYRGLDDLVPAARRSPGSVSYGAANSFGMVSGHKLARAASAQFTQVYYKSSPQIVTDMIGGRVQFAFVDLASVAALMQEGKVRPLAVVADKRFAALASVPTLGEAGYPDFGVVAWFAMFAPAGTPRPVIDRMNRELNAVLARADVRERGSELGLDLFGSTPQELAGYVTEQIAVWGKLTADAGLKPE